MTSHPEFPSRLSPDGRGKIFLRWWERRGAAGYAISNYLDLFRVSDFGFRISGSAGLCFLVAEPSDSSGPVPR